MPLLQKHLSTEMELDIIAGPRCTYSVYIELAIWSVADGQHGQTSKTGD